MHTFILPANSYLLHVRHSSGDCVGHSVFALEQFLMQSMIFTDVQVKIKANSGIR